MKTALSVFGLVTGLAASMALAQESEDQFAKPISEDLGASTENFTQTDGEDLYMTACSGCHGERGGGAYGAANYPALAANARLGTARYPVNLMIEGNGAMPSFAEWLDDEQVAAIATYIRTNMGNSYPEPVTAEDVARMRQNFADLDEG
jgi:mono/diheme cytochrome c family protein